MVDFITNGFPLQGMDVQGKYLKMAMLFFDDEQAEAVVRMLNQGGCQTAGESARDRMGSLRVSYYKNPNALNSNYEVYIIPHFLNIQDCGGTCEAGPHPKLNCPLKVYTLAIFWFVSISPF